MARRATQGLGRAGEGLAAAHLQRCGYTILDRNVRVGRGEIDLLAEERGELVFVEVRLRRGAALGGAAASLDSRKQARLRAAVLGYLTARFGDDPPAWRIDVVAIDLDRTGRLAQVVVLPSALEDEP